MAPLAHAMGTLTAPDVQAFREYCTYVAWGNAHAASGSEQLVRRLARGRKGRALRGNDGQYAAKLFYREADNLAAHFGFTAVSRTKIKIATRDDADSDPVEAARRKARLARQTHLRPA